MSDQNTNKGPQGSPGGNKPPKKSLNFYWIYAVIAAVLIGMMMLNQGSEGREITYADFEVLAADSLIEKTIVYDGRRLRSTSIKRAAKKNKANSTKGSCVLAPAHTTTSMCLLRSAPWRWMRSARPTTLTTSTATAMSLASS